MTLTDQSPHGTCPKCNGPLRIRRAYAFVRLGRPLGLWEFGDGCGFDENTPAYRCRDCNEPVGKFFDPAMVIWDEKHPKPPNWPA